MMKNRIQTGTILHTSAGMCSFATLVLTVAILLAGCEEHASHNQMTDAKNPSEWSILGNGHEQRFFSELKNINAENVSELGLTWYADIPILDGLSGNALVAGGLIYQSGPLGVVFAHDIRTGELRWRYDAEPSWGKSIISDWGARYNRGLALIDDKVVFATADCHLHAIEQKTGELVWKAKSCNPEEFYTITAAPRVGNGMVFTGNACADSGLNRGYLDAFHADTGQQAWRFYTVPGAPPEGGYTDPVMEMAASTWGQDGWWEKTIGCGSVWDGINYDPQTNLVYFGTGGPAPWNPELRGENAGDELFTNAIVAVNADTGEYVWHYSVNPNDAWNYEAAMQMVVTDLTLDGVERRVVMAAPKNGFFYLLDARTGEFISANNFIPVNWTSGLDPETGRPTYTDDAKWWLREEGAEVMPLGVGSRSWHAMSYSEQTGLVYIPAIFTPGWLKAHPEMQMGSVEIDPYPARSGKNTYEVFGALIAWDPVTQTERWRVRHSLPMNSGVISTAGNLVFQASDGKFAAYDAQNGELLWSSNINASPTAAATTVEVDGEQVILLPSGNGASAAVNSLWPDLTSTSETRAPSRLLAFKLGAMQEVPATEILTMPEPMLPRQAENLAEHGFVLAEAYLCTACHGYDGVSLNSSVPDLRSSGILYDLDALRMVVKDGLLADSGMPQFPDISDEELTAIQAYITNNAWDYFQAQTAASTE